MSSILESARGEVFQRWRPTGRAVQKGFKDSDPLNRPLESTPGSRARRPRRFSNFGIRVTTSCINASSS